MCIQCMWEEWGGGVVKSITDIFAMFYDFLYVLPYTAPQTPFPLNLFQYCCKIYSQCESPAVGNSKWRPPSVPVDVLGIDVMFSVELDQLLAFGLVQPDAQRTVRVKHNLK